MLEEGGIARWHGGRGERGVTMGLCATVYSVGGKELRGGGGGERKKRALRFWVSPHKYT